MTQDVNSHTVRLTEMLKIAGFIVIGTSAYFSIISSISIIQKDVNTLMTQNKEILEKYVVIDNKQDSLALKINALETLEDFRHTKK